VRGKVGGIIREAGGKIKGLFKFKKFMKNLTYLITSNQNTFIYLYQ